MIIENELETEYSKEFKYKWNIKSLEIKCVEENDFYTINNYLFKFEYIIMINRNAEYLVYNNEEVKYSNIDSVLKFGDKFLEYKRFKNNLREF